MPEQHAKSLKKLSKKFIGKSDINRITDDLRVKHVKYELEIKQDNKGIASETGWKWFKSQTR